MRVRIRPKAVPLTVLVTLFAALLGVGGCSDPGNVSISNSDDPRSGGKSGFDVTTTEQLGGTVPADDVEAEVTAPPAANAAVPEDDSEALQAAVASYGAALGTPSIRALEFIVQFPQDQAAYAFLQSQDPAVPANVDEREWRRGIVGDPEPVRLTDPTANLEPHLFSLDEIDWAAIASVLPTAPAAVEGRIGPLSNSTGVTHLIAQRNLPFSGDVVVRVYVDGGDRSTGGYVQYLANGTLDRVQA